MVERDRETLTIKVWEERYVVQSPGESKMEQVPVYSGEAGRGSWTVSKERAEYIAGFWDS